MDLHYDLRTLHLPQEVITCIASHLSLAPYIRSIRLVNRAFNIAGTALMIPTPASPSTLFTHPTPEQVEEVEQAQPFERLYRYTPRPLTIWTWLRIPAGITIEDRRTDLGREFVKLVVAPSSADYMDNHSASGKDRVDQTSGRKGTCWGRVQERPDEFCIIMQWQSRLYWNAFRSGAEAPALREFLENVVPGCIGTSTSEEMPVPSQFKHRQPLFASLCEIRTLYFRIGMAADRKATIDAERRIGRYYGIESFLPLGSVQSGYSVVFWLQGWRRRQVHLTKPLCIVFPDELERRMMLRLRGESGVSDASPVSEKGADRIESRFAHEDRVGSESIHCDFYAGPWYS